MRNYESYKDSGIEWIGEIPEHWMVKKLKYLGESIIGITYSPNDVTDEQNGTLVLRSSNIQNGRLTYDDCVYINKEIPEKLLTKAGDILICARNGSADLVGKNACIDGNSTGYTFGAFMTILRTKHYRFLSYFLSSNIFKTQLGSFSTSTINQLTSSFLNNLEVALPEEESEQEAIADFLDQKPTVWITLSRKSNN
ncbi:MAG TPA: restriction endonuclease subunit S [Flavisolibacter sp.]|nr:restriction endonuclease subunit S [Flavisolibacter sp.]